jgi:hypothetical protein
MIVVGNHQPRRGGIIIARSLRGKPKPRRGDIIFLYNLVSIIISPLRGWYGCLVQCSIIMSPLRGYLKREFAINKHATAFGVVVCTGICDAINLRPPSGSGVYLIWRFYKWFRFCFFTQFHSEPVPEGDTCL